MSQPPPAIPPPPPPPPVSPSTRPVWKRWWLWVGLVVLIIIAANVGTPETGGDSASPGAETSAPPIEVQESASPDESLEPPPSPETPPEPDPIKLQGSGHQATRPFNLVGGFTTFHVQATGSSNVIVYLVNDRGRKVQLLVNEIGSFDGVSGVGVKPGKFLVDIDAPGTWSVQIEQPRPSSGKSPPQTYSGSQPDVLGPLTFDGLTRVAMKYSGGSNFIVYLLNDRGVTIDLLANEIGHTNGSTAISGNGGIYWLTVDAIGKWMVKVQ